MENGQWGKTRACNEPLHLPGFLSLQWNIKTSCSFLHLCILRLFRNFALTMSVSLWSAHIHQCIFILKVKTAMKTKCFDACLWNNMFFLVLSSFFQSKQLYPFYIWWRKRNIFLLKSVISMCIRGLNKGRNLHVKLLLRSCCPFHDAHDNFKNMSSSASTSKFSARKRSLFSLCN